jgi:phosphoribosylglycinamide formyltransferase-1
MSGAKRIVVLISGRGSNMEALLKARLPATIAAVISNNPDAAGLAVARDHGLPVAALDHRAYTERAHFDAALALEIEKHEPHVVALAGFMRVLTRGFIERFEGRLLNIHPSLLPAFPGLHTHRRALEAGVRIHGCTVHYVTPVLDGGPVIAQAAVPVLGSDTEETLAARVLAEEHRIYPQAVRWVCEGRARVEANLRVSIDGAGDAAGVLLSPALDS